MGPRLLRLELADIFVVVAFSLHIVMCPYAKVEGTFNLQAIHDLFIHGPRDIAQFDYVEFPGVVPRTFIGALGVAFVSSPIAWLWSVLGLEKIVLQYVVRWVLAALNFAALLFFKRSIVSRFGKDTARFFMLICGSQFHLMFYLGRTLPNTFALGLVLCAYAYWIRHAVHRACIFFTVTIIVFRADTAVLFAPVLLWILLSTKGDLRKILRIVALGIATTLASLALTVAVDSYFWGRWLWPEGEVLWFNTVENRSHEWGVSPPLWYFYSALPRALLATAILIPFGISPRLVAILKSPSWKHTLDVAAYEPLVDRSVWTLVWPILAFVTLYSLLPHKELRFIFYAIPIFNMAAAVGAAKLCGKQKKALGSRSVTHGKLKHTQAGALVVSGCIAGTLVATLFFFAASSVNYPGGHALSRLHELYADEEDLPLKIHIDVPSYMTGALRFGQEFPSWSYATEESVVVMHPPPLASFDILLTAKPPASLASDFELVEAIRAFNHVQFTSFPPQIHTKELIYILRHHKVAQRRSGSTQ